MRTYLEDFLRDLRAELDEAVFVLPVLLLVTFGLANFGMLGYAGTVASNAANYGARLGSVALEDPLGSAGAAAQSVVSGAGGAVYRISVAGSSQPGGLVRVSVTYEVPNFFAGPARLFGLSTPASFSGTARADFRKEGW